MDLAAFLSQPITQIGGLVAVLVALQKYGVDVRAVFKAALGIDSGVKDVNSDFRNALQPLLTQMESLAQYANHDTTEGLKAVKEVLSKLDDKMDEHVREHDKSLFILEEISKNGVRCRGEK